MSKARQVTATHDLPSLDTPTISFREHRTLVTDIISVRSAHGEVHPLSSTPTPLPHKVTCRACGSPLMDEGRNMIMAFPPSFEFPRTQKDLEEMNAEIGKIHQNVDGNGNGNQDHAVAVEKHGKPGKWDKVSMPSELLPKHHIFYERRIIDVLDGLPKWRHLENTEEMGEKDR